MLVQHRSGWGVLEHNLRERPYQDDINFSIAFISIDGDEEIVVYPERVCSDIETISGSCQLNCAGTLVFMWDNSYSWFTNKLLTYIVNIEQVRFRYVICLPQ